GAVLVELAAALVAEAGAEVVLAAAAGAAVRQFAGGHGHERPLGALDDLQITDDEGVIERHRAERLQAFVLRVIFHELDTDFGADHVYSRVDGGKLNRNYEPQGHEPALGPPVRRAGRVLFEEHRRRHGPGRRPCCRCRSSSPRGAPTPSTAPASARPPDTGSLPAP